MITIELQKELPRIYESISTSDVYMNSQGDLYFVTTIDSYEDDMYHCICIPNSKTYLTMTTLFRDVLKSMKYLGQQSNFDITIKQK